MLYDDKMIKKRMRITLMRCRTESCSRINRQSWQTTPGTALASTRSLLLMLRARSSSLSARFRLSSTSTLSPPSRMILCLCPSPSGSLGRRWSAERERTSTGRTASVRIPWLPWQFQARTLYWWGLAAIDSTRHAVRVQYSRIRRGRSRSSFWSWITFSSRWLSRFKGYKTEWAHLQHWTRPHWWVSWWEVGIALIVDCRFSPYWVIVVLIIK